MELLKLVTDAPRAIHNLEARRRLLLGTDNWTQIEVASKGKNRKAIRPSPLQSNIRSVSPESPALYTKTMQREATSSQPISPLQARYDSHGSRSGSGLLPQCNENEDIAYFSCSQHANSGQEGDVSETVSNIAAFDSDEDNLTHNQQKSIEADITINPAYNLSSISTLPFLPPPYCFYTHISQFACRSTNLT